MFGNKEDFMETDRFHGSLEILGGLSSRPGDALEEISAKPHLVSGAIVTGLTVFGQVMSGPLPWEAGLFLWGHRFIALFSKGFFAWMGPVLILHAVSRLFNKKGSVSSLLAVTGWAGAVLWPAMVFRLLEPGSGVLGIFVTGTVLLFQLLHYGVWGWGVHRIYGWSKVQAVILLLVGFLAFSGVSLILRLASGIVSFIGSVFPFPS